MSDYSRPHGLQPTSLLRPWDFQARVLEWGAIAFSDISSTNHQIPMSLRVTTIHLVPCADHLRVTLQLPLIQL